jgi:hypothetical protein
MRPAPIGSFRMSTDQNAHRPPLVLVLALLGWAALVYAAYVASYLS